MARVPISYMFPARAGMSRINQGTKENKMYVPRASGDEPASAAWELERGRCSPRERG